MSASPSETPHEQPDRLRGGPALRLHATFLVGVAFCAVAFWFELHRAEGGNELSWAYVFEWPLLAIFAFYMWWKFLHPGREAAKARRKPAAPPIAPEYGEMLAAWQEHQRVLADRHAADDAAAGPLGPPGTP